LRGDLFCSRCLQVQVLEWRFGGFRIAFPLSVEMSLSTTSTLLQSFSPIPLFPPLPLLSASLPLPSLTLSLPPQARPLPPPPHKTQNLHPFMEIRLLRSVASSQSLLLRLFAPRVPHHCERVPDLALLRALATPPGAPVIYGAFPARARARDRVEERRLRRLDGTPGEEDCSDASVYGCCSRFRLASGELSRDCLEGKTRCP
jgi:hypothetical protein